jgi:rhamnulose-1-phosphate aldolase/alcohol dehydrogenase
MSHLIQSTPPTAAASFKHVTNLWDDAVAANLDPVGRLVYRSNLLGSDPRITNTGGGNTSAKLVERDPITGEPVEVLWVKGSGGDLRTAGREFFSSLYQHKLLSLQAVYAGAEIRGPKTPAEDAMVAMYPHCTFNLNTRAPSIDTPLHSFVPFKHVDHMHPVSCIAIATAQDGPALTREVFGDEIVWTDWQRPGFELGLVLQQICRDHPQARGVILGQHGLINWADDEKECYLLTLSLIDRAEGFLASRTGSDPVFGGPRVQPLPAAGRQELLTRLLPWLRGQVSGERRMIGTVETEGDVLEFACSADAPRLAELGTSCPDHFLRTKIKPLYVDWDPRIEDEAALRCKLAAGLEAYRQDYAAYYEACRHVDSPAMRGADPTVILIPGVGMVAWGKNKSESRVTAEFYTAAVRVMQRADAVSEYTALPRQEAFDIEYWQLEEAKLKRMPPEKELAREVAVIVGAGSGIGRSLAERLIRDGAAVVSLDLNQEAAEETAERILGRVGVGIGVAGSGISACGEVIGLGCDMTDRGSVRAALETAVLAYGGFDHVVITAGLYPTPDPEGRVLDASWAEAFAVNVTGPFMVADEAARIWTEQNLSGSLVITTSVNAVIPKKGSFAYDTSKAAANHLIRELAVALAPLIRVNGVAPATVVEGSAMFPRDRVIASLAKYDLPYGEDESTEVLRDRLAAFYARRTLIGQPITPEDQAEAIALLVGPRLGKSTGQILSVDGGLHEAFQR